MENEVTKILRFEDLKKLFKVSRSSLDRWEVKGNFPKRVHLGVNSVGWRSNEIYEWLKNK